MAISGRSARRRNVASWQEALTKCKEELKFPGVAAVPRRFCNSLGSWNALWDSRSDLGALLGAPGELLERSRALPGPSGSALGSSRSTPGRLPECSWELLGSPWSSLGCPWAARRGSGAPFSSVFLGFFLGFSRVLWLRPKWLKFLNARQGSETQHVFFVYIYIYIYTHKCY